MIPKEHPRYESLMLREKMVDAYKAGIVTNAGLIAHGRGEAFDYLIGERTTETAKRAVHAAAASLLLAKNPVISVNGNTAALVPGAIVKLSDIIKGKLEINLFYRTPHRVEAIYKVLKKAGARLILGGGEEILESLAGLEGPRNKVSLEGIYQADVILVPLEDGDRTEALVANKKFVIAIDLNPISRTSKRASISIVDNVVRTILLLIAEVESIRNYNRLELRKIVEDFDNSKNLDESLKHISKVIFRDVKL